MAYDVKVRDMLNQKGVSGNRVGYDPKSGSVLVDNKPFMKPEKNYNGTTYTSTDSFNNAYNQFSKPQNKPITQTAQQVAPAVQAPQTQMSSVSTYSPQSTGQTYQPAKNPMDAQYEQVLSQLMQFQNNRQPVDPYSTDAYRAAQAQSQRAQQAQTRAAQESYGSAGFGRSTALGERVAGIAGDQQEYLMTQVIPQIIAQEEARKQQEYTNMLNLLNPLFQQQQLQDTRQQNQFSNRLAEGEATGRYIPQEAQNILNQLLGLKQQAESGNVSPEQMTQFSGEGDRLRQQLAPFVDPSQFGSGVSYEQALQNMRTAFPTAQAQNQEFSQGLQARQQELSEVQIMAALTGFLPDGTPTSAEQQRQLQNEWMVANQTGRITPTLAQLYGLPENTPTFEAQQAAINNAMQRQQIGISGMNAQTSRMSANNSAANSERARLMDIWQSTGVAPAGIDGVTPGTPLYDPVAARQGNEPQEPTKNQLEATYVSAIDQMTPENRKSFFENEKSAIIEELGMSGYDKLKSMYGIFSVGR